MTDIYLLDARRAEVERVNKVTAPELMQAMTDGYGHAGRALIRLEYALTLAKAAAEERKAVVMLDVAPEILKSKGLVKPSNPSGSADLREAVLALDAEHKRLQEQVAMIEAAKELLKLKAKQFEQSYQSVKKVYDSLSSINALANGITKPASAAPYAPELQSSPAMEINPRSTPTVATGGFAIGKPRYT